MCGTPGTVFAWFGAIFINISFGVSLKKRKNQTKLIYVLIFAFIFFCYDTHLNIFFDNMGYHNVMDNRIFVIFY